MQVPQTQPTKPTVQMEIPAPQPPPAPPFPPPKPIEPPHGKSNKLIYALITLIFLLSAGVGVSAYYLISTNKQNSALKKENEELTAKLKVKEEEKAQTPFGQISDEEKEQLESKPEIKPLIEGVKTEFGSGIEITADLMSVEKKENGVYIVWRFNCAETEQLCLISGGLTKDVKNADYNPAINNYLLDLETQQKYYMKTRPDGAPIATAGVFSMKQGKSIEFNAEFEAVPETTKLVEISVNKTSPFTNVTIY